MFILSKPKNLIFSGIFCLGGVAYLGLPAVLKQSLYLNQVGCYPVVTSSSCSQNMVFFVAPSLWEQFCWWVCCRSCWAYCSCLWGLNTSQHSRSDFRDTSNTLQSVSIAQLTEACKRQHTGFSTGHQDFTCSSCLAFLSGPLPIYTYFIQIYSYFILTIHTAIPAESTF